MDSVLEGKLIDCLDALERGETLEEILRRYPDDAAALRPLLETAHQLATLPVGYSVNAQRSSRNAFLQQAAQLREGSRRRPFWDWLWRPQLNPSFLAAALVVMLMGALLFTLWDDLQPDETLAPNETITIPALMETPTTSPTNSATTPQVTPIPTTSTPTPQEMPTILSTATVTPSQPTGTATSTATSTTTPTPTRPTYTPTPQPSDTPLPPPTSAPAPTSTPDDDNENENENDNENENENENNSGPGDGNDNDD